MKKLFFAVMALAFAAVACQNSDINYTGKDAVVITLGVDAPELGATRGGETDMNSALGAIDNFNDDEWAKYDVRYMLEIYDVTEGYEDLDTPVKARAINTHSTYEPTRFELRLIPNRTYKFVVWADIVEEGSTDDLNYNTADLRNITRIGDARAMDESMDAYFIQEDIYITTSLSKTLTLTRPFGKVRVVATDIDEVNIGTTAETVKVYFYNHPILTSLNALTGQAHTTTDTVEYTYTIAKDAPYTGGYDSEAMNQTLFADYIFADRDNAQEINFRMDVIDQNGRPVRSHDFSTQIPLERNHLTTIIGNLLTTSTEFEIHIDDNFEDEYVEEIEDDQFANDPIVAEALTVAAYDGSSALTFNDNNGNEFIINIPDEMLVNDALATGEYEYGDFTVSDMKFVVPATRAAEAVDVKAVGGKMIIAEGENEGELKFTLNLIVVEQEDETKAYYPTFYFEGAIAKTALATPNLTVTGEANGSDYVVTATWDAIPGAKNYAYSYGTGGGKSTEPCATYTIKNFETDKTYTLTVEALPVNSTLYAASAKATYEFEIEAVVEPTPLATPVVEATADFNVITITWGAVEGAAKYSVKVGDNESVEVEEITYEFTGEYETEYNITVVALPADETLHTASEPATLIVTTEREPKALAAPEITAGIVNYRDVTISWTSVDGAVSYELYIDGAKTDFTDNAYTFSGKYDTKYTIKVVAVSDPTDKFTLDSSSEYTLTTEPDPYIYLKPNSNWTKDGARFAVYTWIGDGAAKQEYWYSMEAVGDGTYRVLKSKLQTNIIFCRMNPSTTANNWNNKWNQTSDLKTPTDGKNLYTVKDDTWDKGGGTWSIKQ